MVAEYLVCSSCGGDGKVGTMGGDFVKCSLCKTTGFVSVDSSEQGGSVYVDCKPCLASGRMPYTRDKLGTYMCTDCRGKGKVPKKSEQKPELVYCDKCDGRGFFSDGESCPKCDGEGRHLPDLKQESAPVMTTRPCRICHGKGEVQSHPSASYRECLYCSGKGSIPVSSADGLIADALDQTSQAEFPAKVQCVICFGKGHFVDVVKDGVSYKRVECTKCDGTGWVLKDKREPVPEVDMTQDTFHGLLQSWVEAQRRHMEAVKMETEARKKCNKTRTDVERLVDVIFKNTEYFPNGVSEEGKFFLLQSGTVVQTSKFGIHIVILEAL